MSLSLAPVWAWGYQSILKPIFFRFDPEAVHEHMTEVGQKLGRYRLGRSLTAWAFAYANPKLRQVVAGIQFANPVGLAAGFDKEGVLADILPSVGFGFAELGSITGEPCVGNPRPRLWRLPKSKSLLVYYGLKNAGAEVIAARLKARRFAMPIGISVAKTNDAATVEIQAGIDDYVKAYRTFVAAGVGDYYTVNISCPNTFGGEPFTDPAKLELLLAAMTEVKNRKPIFLKMPAELELSVVDKIVDLAMRFGVSGLISTNLAKSRDTDKLKDMNVPTFGGMSGKVVGDLAEAQIRYIYQKTQGRLVLIGCGGIFNAEDAYRKIRAGAYLVQMITGMIYEGPQVIGEINRGLVKLLERDGYNNISEAVGADVTI